MNTLPLAIGPLHSWALIGLIFVAVAIFIRLLMAIDGHLYGRPAQQTEVEAESDVTAAVQSHAAAPPAKLVRREKFEPYDYEVQGI